MDDLISRAAALDALGEEPLVWEYDDDYTLGMRNMYVFFKESLEALPSAKSVDKDINIPVNDTIYRHDAIRKFCADHCGCKPEECGYTLEEDGAEECSVVRFLKSLPSAQPDWDEMIVICDCCGHTIHVQRQYADMRKGGDGNEAD